MKKIQLGIADGEPITIDLDTLINTRLLVTASSGGGKSYTLRRIIEEAHPHVQVIVIDTEGEFATLRDKYPFVLIGEGGEAPADIRTAEQVALKLLELQVSAVCDIYEMKPIHNRHVWVERFLNALVHAPKELWHPVLVILDEAHIYSPEKGYSESCAKEAVMSLASLGRKRGFALIAATQRLSKLDKNTVEPLQNYIVGQTYYDDQKRAAGVFKIDPGAATREFSLELERLKPGNFIVRGRAFNHDMARVKITSPHTRPPKTGTELAGRIIPTPEAIKHLLPKLAELPQEAEKKQQADDDTRRQLREAQGEIMRLSEELEQMARRVGHFEAETMQHRQRLDAAREVAAQLLAMLSPLTTADELEEYARNASVAYRERTSEANTPAETHTAAPVRKPQPNGSSKLRPGAIRMLAALAQWYPQGRTEGQVAAASKMTRKGGSWTSYKSELNTSGLIEVRDGMMYATPAGRAYFGDELPATPTTTADVVALWTTKLRPGARRMLDALIKVKGSTLNRSALADYAKVSEAGGSFTSYISELRTAGLVITDKNGVRANREALLI